MTPMKTLGTAAMLAVLAGSAQAQMQAPQSTTPQQMIDAAKKSEQADVERRYNAEIKRQRGQPTPEASKPDPWSNARTVTPPRDKR